MAAKNAPLKILHQAHLGQLHLYFEAVGPRGTGNASLQQTMHRLHGGYGSDHRLELGLELGVAPLVKRGHPFIGEWAARVGLDACGLAANGFA